MHIRTFAVSFAAIALAGAPALGQSSAFQQEVDGWLERYQATYQKLYTENSIAQWASNTHIVKGDTINAARANAAAEALSRFVGSIENINTLRKYLARKSELARLETLQLEAILYNAADAPQTVPDVVTRRIAL